MSRLVHVVSRSEKYGQTSAFNHQYNAFADLLSTLGENFYSEESESGVSRFEIRKDEYKKVIEKLKNINSLDQMDFEEVQECIKNFDDCDVQTIIVKMEKFLEEADKENDWIVFSVW